MGRWLGWFLALAGCGSAAVGQGTMTPDAAAPMPDPDGGEPPAAERLLFIGNSFTFVNDVPGHLRALLPRSTTEQVAPGGYTLAQHAADARTDGTDLARWLRTGTPEETAFDAVILQEQSQLGGFPSILADRIASIAAASELSALASARADAVVLYMTWGYQNGDPNNDLLGYRTFSGMQDRLDEGYLGLAALLAEQGAKVRVAPVGGGFRTVFEDVTRAGGDPLAAGSEFAQLYDSDGMHPSLEGAYLAACIIAGTVRTTDVRHLAGEPNLGADTSARLRDVCARALADPRWNLPVIHRADAQLAGDAAQYTFFGSAVALSGDGMRLLVGQPRRGLVVSPSPSARVYLRSGADWSLEDQWIGSAGFASSAALSGDGSRALLGPAASVRARNGATWSEEAALPQDSDRQAGSVALDASGSRAIVSVVGGPDVGPDEVTARIFVSTPQGWVEEGVALGRSTAWFGAQVAIDGDGARAVVGEDPVRVLTRGGNGWSEEAQLPAKGGSVAISGDGARILVGQPDSSLALLFLRNGTAWSLEATLRGALLSHLGTSVALSSDGRRALVGAPEDLPVATQAVSGSLRVFDLGDGGFRHTLLLVPRLPLAAGAPGQLGASAAMTSDGSLVAAGAPSTEAGDNMYVGVGYTFALP